MSDVDCMACLANDAAGLPHEGVVEVIDGVSHWMVMPLGLSSDSRHPCAIHEFSWNALIEHWVSGGRPMLFVPRAKSGLVTRVGL